MKKNVIIPLVYITSAIALITVLCLIVGQALHDKDNTGSAPGPAGTQYVLGDDVAADSYYTVDLTDDGVAVSPYLYGLFFEDINYAADGGLYAELINNRSFEFFPMPSNGNDENSHLYAWEVSESATVTVLNEEGMNANNSYYVLLDTKVSGQGLSNSGYSNISIKEGEKYRVSFYAKGDYKGKYTATLYEGDNPYGSVTIKGKACKEWTKFTGVIVATGSSYKGKFTLSLDEPGQVNLDMISLFPVNTYNNRENGLRADMVTLLKEMNPSFLRFPGGCIIEGEGLDNAYNWKDSVGDVEARPTIFNRWRRDGSSGYYYQSYGLGFYEYFCLCEDLVCEPLPCINAGISCYGPEYASTDDMQQYIDDAIDLIEFANGDPKTNEWAALRAKMGHKEPFNLTMLEIGNEQIADERYYERFEMFEEQIHAKYPEIRLISSVGGLSNGVGTPTTTWLDGKTRSFAYANDEHFYEKDKWFLSNTYRYDVMDRDEDAYVFAGEYACHYSDTNPLYNAVCEAAFMTGFERNSDIVCMTCYAPLFNKIGNTQWGPDLIYFTNQGVYGTPSYYVQKMFSTNRGTKTLPDNIVSPSPDNPSSDIETYAGLGSWNTLTEYDDVVITDNVTGEVLYSNDFESFEKNGKLALTSGFSIEDGVLRQHDAYSIENAFNFDIGLHNNYTYSVKARKISGDEGFIIPFLVTDSKNYFHLNLGGWSNTYSAVEQCIDGVKTIAGSSAFIVEENVWYNIKIVVKPTQVYGYVDDELIIVINLPTLQSVYATASFDDDTKDIILKLVNSTKEDNVVSITLNGAESISTVADMYSMGDTNRKAYNTIVNPTAVSPEYTLLEGVSDCFSMSLSPYSVTVLRIHTR